MLIRTRRVIVVKSPDQVSDFVDKCVVAYGSIINNHTKSTTRIDLYTVGATCKISVCNKEYHNICAILSAKRMEIIHVTICCALQAGNICKGITSFIVAHLSGMNHINLRVDIAVGQGFIGGLFTGSDKA